jgi:hypothetical protein
MQADITILSGNAGAGFFFRDESYTDYWGVFVSPDGNYELAYQNQIVTSIFSPIIKTGHNQTNRLAIIAQKHTIYVYINNQFITRVSSNLESVPI